MTFRDNFFYTIALLAVVAIAGFAYFAFQVDWALAPEEGEEVIAEAAPVAELTAEQETGKKVFRTYCASCHQLNRDMTGPALAGVGQKYAGDEEWLYKWIRNAPGMINSGDPKAVALYEVWGTMMQANPTLTDVDIAAILAYTDQ